MTTDNALVMCRLAAVEYSQSGVPKFRCMHRGRGCKQPRKRAEGLERAVEERLRRQIDALLAEGAHQAVEMERRDEVAIRFEEVAALLEDLDVDRIWAAADEQERRVLVEELVESVAIFPDYLQVTVTGAPPLNVLLEEVGLQQGVQSVGVGERT